MNQEGNTPSLLVIPIMEGSIIFYGGGKLNGKFLGFERSYPQLDRQRIFRMVQVEYEAFIWSLSKKKCLKVVESMHSKIL